MRQHQRGFKSNRASFKVHGSMEERLASQIKRIYHDTKKAIGECNFLSKQQLEQLMLRPSEEELIRSVDGNRACLIEAATLLRELHTRFLRCFVLSAFDFTWDMMTTPRRFEYITQKELELYNSLMNIANLKQDEIRAMIKESIGSLKKDLMNSMVNFSTPTTTTTTTPNNNNNSTNNGRQTGNHAASTATTDYSSSAVTSSLQSLSLEGGSKDEEQYCCNSVSSSTSSSRVTNLSIQSLENISSRNELQLYRQEIQEFVLQQLNESIASKLVGSVDSLRKSYIGTLERCLESLEQNSHSQRELREAPPQALLAFRQILNAAYRVEVSVQSSTSIMSVLWEKMKQLVSTSLPFWSLHWYTGGGCIIDEKWKRQQALDMLNDLSDWRLAKSICSQFRERLKASHEQFQLTFRELEYQHADRLEHTEELRLRVRKMHAPRMAKFVLESTSLIDLILHGMPQLEKEIGRGQYGVVYACNSWAGRSHCAVKSVVPPDDKYWNELAMEFYYTRCIPEHERIVNIYGSVIDHSYGSGSTPAVLLVMERLNKDLYSAIKSGLDFLSRLQVAIDVVEGIRFLHNQGLVHRDIKLKNILLDVNNRAKITDLGFCKPEAMMSGSVVGTPIHMSPELFSGRYDNSVDVYAFGILFWYICAGHVRLPIIFGLCQTRDQLWNCVRRGVRPEKLPQFDNECWQLMVQCWDGDRTKRPHLGDVEIKLRQIHAKYT